MRPRQAGMKYTLKKLPWSKLKSLLKMGEGTLSTEILENLPDIFSEHLSLQLEART